MAQQTNGAAQASDDTGMSASSDELKALKAQLEQANAGREQERTQRTNLEKDATSVRQQAVTAKDNEIAAHEQAATSAIAAASSDLERAKRDYAAAMETQNYAACADAQDQIATARLRLESANQYKANVETTKTQWGQQREAIARQPVQQPDPLASFTPAARDWIGRHPQFLSDKRYQAKVQAAHFKAMANDIESDSPKYFEFVETEIGERQAQTQTDDNDGFGVDLAEPEVEEAPPPSPAPRQRQANSSMGAPPSRSVPTQAGGRPNRVTLTAQQMEAARISFPDEFKKSPQDAYKAYISNYEALRRAGKMN